MFTSTSLDKPFVHQLKELLPNKVMNSEEILQKHSQNQFYTQGHQPDAVCFPESEEDVLNIVDFCLERKIPIVPYGSGTSVEGHTALVKNGVCVNLSKMNKILEVNASDEYVVVQPGISYNTLNDHLAAHNLYFPVEAGWGASIGGMVSTNASGAGAVHAGSMSKNTMECRLVTYENNKAKTVRMGTRCQKSSAGYDLLRLIVGAEGTLGIITQVCLRIKPLPSHYKTICCQFDELQEAIDFVIHIKKLVFFKKVELLDKLQTKACLSFSALNEFSPEKNTILIELSGDETHVSSEIKIIVDYLEKRKNNHFSIYENQKTAEPIWKMRKNACPAAIQHLAPHKKAMATDVCVPLSSLADCIQACYKHMGALNIVAPLVAHVGDGNFHFTILINPNDPSEIEHAKKFNELVINEALARNGTCTGEHGVGIGKMASLQREHGDILFLMEKVKAAFDPLNLFNPGKIITLKKNCQYEINAEPALSMNMNAQT